MDTTKEALEQLVANAKKRLDDAQIQLESARADYEAFAVALRRYTGETHHVLIAEAGNFRMIGSSANLTADQPTILSKTDIVRIIIAERPPMTVGEIFDLLPDNPQYERRDLYRVMNSLVKQKDVIKQDGKYHVTQRLRDQVLELTNLQ